MVPEQQRCDALDRWQSRAQAMMQTWLLMCQPHCALLTHSPRLEMPPLREQSTAAVLLRTLPVTVRGADMPAVKVKGMLYSATSAPLRHSRKG